MNDDERKDNGERKKKDQVKNVEKKEEGSMESGTNTASSFPNKYEAAIIAAKEARRLNDILRCSGEEAKEKVTLVAIDRVTKGKVKFAYEEQEGRRE